MDTFAHLIAVGQDTGKPTPLSKVGMSRHRFKRMPCFLKLQEKKHLKRNCSWHRQSI